ncbi:hypothetical protein CRG98_000452 [Punica granatum]|uniref:Uncharacterized protein n=1 Tax=Punica granatum TaxID=22663 RepID=A0A2I0LES0_PUNGR|nr:hypothetical protein CRG98_000452 [Punica granatum]
MAEEQGRNKEIKDAVAPRREAVKEIKGVVDDLPDCTYKYEAKSYENQLKRRTGQEMEGPKGLPHEQVPQPGDFSSEALERL